MSELKSVDGSDVNQKHVKLAMFIIENKITSIDISFSGAGDSGEYGDLQYNFKKDSPVGDLLTDHKSIPDICYEILDYYVSPDFNNEGCHGNITFYVEDGELKFDATCTVMIPEDKTYGEILLDTNML